MRKCLIPLLFVTLLGVGLAALSWCSRPTPALARENAKEAMLAHNVFFTLKDKSPEARQKLVDAAQKHLTNHPGTAFFACGTVADLDRPVNDVDFDVALHVIFETRADHDTYQTAPRHLKFIEENRENWEKVRVFDSDVE